MYKLGDDGATYRSLPPNMICDEDKLEVFCSVVDKHMKELAALADKLNIWGNLDNVDPKYYDAMASCLDAPYYKSSYDDDTKLRVIKSAILKRRYAGTKRGMKELVKTIYPGGQFIPWYEYDGKPYHFKIIANSLSQEEVTLSVKDVKAARSVLDFVESFAGAKLDECVICIANVSQSVSADCNISGDGKLSMNEYSVASALATNEIRISSNLFEDINTETKENAALCAQSVSTVCATATE